MKEFVAYIVKNLFSDTKVQNQCCRVGQIKLFEANRPLFAKYHDDIAEKWAQKAEEYQQSHPELDLHLLMISTIAASTLEGKDELWFWIGNTDEGLNHLRTFLDNFRAASETTQNNLSLELRGPLSGMMEKIFKENFLSIPIITNYNVRKDQKGPVAILKFNLGSLNSRKAMISPYLPRLVS